MPSGYEKSSDYGGPSPTWRGAIVLAIVLGLVALGLWMVL